MNKYKPLLTVQKGKMLEISTIRIGRNGLGVFLTHQLGRIIINLKPTVKNWPGKVVSGIEHSKRRH